MCLLLVGGPFAVPTACRTHVAVCRDRVFRKFRTRGNLIIRHIGKDCSGRSYGVPGILRMKQQTRMSTKSWPFGRLGPSMSRLGP